MFNHTIPKHFDFSSYSNVSDFTDLQITFQNFRVSIYLILQEKYNYPKNTKKKKVTKRKHEYC